MTDEEIMTNESYHTCGRCKYDTLPESMYPCNQCIHSKDTRKDLCVFKAESEEEE